jgi:ribonuclease HI
MSIHIYTDGGIFQKGLKIGSWAFCYTLDPTSRKIIEWGSGAQLDSTCNQMELSAVINAITYFLNSDHAKRHTDIKVYSDSQYVVHSLYFEFVNQWAQAGWIDRDGKETKNKDLWIKLLETIRIAKHKGYTFDWIWVKGHNGDYFNEFCDKLCTKVKNMYQSIKGQENAAVTQHNKDIRRIEEILS